jgi:ABC-type Fe3+-hydroxamate transport system substrate-binding protein
MRIVSLVPSLTELLCDLGLESDIVGVTKFCVHPAHLRKQVQVIGGTKDIKTNLIDTLQPDLIIANKEENLEGPVSELALKYEVMLTEIKTYQDALDCIKGIGVRTKTEQNAQIIIERIEKERLLLDQSTQAHTHRPLTMYLVWRAPYMSIGGDTFIHDMLSLAGYNNVFASQTRYPTIHLADHPWPKATEIMLSSEPYPFKTKHIAELRAHFPEARIRLVDGEAFSWYGSRMAQSLKYLRSLHAYV